MLCTTATGKHYHENSFLIQESVVNQKHCFIKISIVCLVKGNCFIAFRAAAYSKLGNYAGAVQDCEWAIGIDPNYSKAYGRMG